jgi:hypothetical protein
MFYFFWAGSILIRPFEVRLTDPTLAAKTKARRGWGTQGRLIHSGRINKWMGFEGHPF